ncbi:hypothetical protein RAMLITH_21335 [Ramlibacter sp. RBP-2]|uniref:YXWGXW repeat-containing protein n=1 Tax=Ramlibacter lithotrophicus TaxID=2606681 RepID=A0A7X6I8G6_9BURK|nr:YXWGXW repeat-containing protein [Ramlibacter lithotrophicus]NKE68365.1 hypothetical protein [Ramlibacter lithotrophicus]
MRNQVLLALVIAASATLAVDVQAKKPAPARKAPAEVAVDVPPPSGTWEPSPAPANGHVWSAGYYDWTGDRYQWKPGEWVLAKEGMEYRQRKWVQRADGKWILTGGDWVEKPDNVAGKQ